MEILKPVFCATALMGMHITSPLMAILLDTNTKYSKIMSVFQKLYNDVINLTTSCRLQSVLFHLYQLRYLSKQLQQLLL